MKKLVILLAAVGFLVAENYIISACRPDSYAETGGPLYCGNGIRFPSPPKVVGDKDRTDSWFGDRSIGMVVDIPAAEVSEFKRISQLEFKPGVPPQTGKWTDGDTGAELKQGAASHTTTGYGRTIVLLERNDRPARIYLDLHC